MAIGDQVRNHVVHVRIEDDEPATYGPYTQRKATELAERFNERVEAGDFADTHGYLHASALRIDNPQSVKDILREFGH